MEQETAAAPAAEEMPGAEEVSAEEVSVEALVESAAWDESGPPDASVRAVIEAIVYVTEEPVNATQIAQALVLPVEKVERLLAELAAEFSRPEHGLIIREVAGGYKMGTKAEHHEAIRAFARSLKPPLKLSLAALETLAVIAYKQPITAPEIGEIRGVQGTGVLKTLLDRKLITTAGRKNVIGKPILYRTTKDFLLQFGLKDLAELPTLKEFEELRRLAFNEDPVELEPAAAAADSGEEVLPEEALPEEALPENALPEQAAEQAPEPGAHG